MSNSERNRVLIVDDEKSNLEVLFGILNSEYTVFTAKNGTAAIEIAGKYLPDIVLLDIILPDMNGFDVLASLKASDKTKNIPIIFITGLNSVEDEEKGLDLEAADFIHKPFSTKIVKSRVRNQIQIVNKIRALVALNKDLGAAVQAAESGRTEMPETQAAEANAGDDYDSFIEGVNTIDEINTEIGFGWLSGDKETYCNTLNIFFKNILPECDNMTSSLEAKDLNNFSISVHAMKSSLAIIGALQLSDIAFKLETASKNQEIDYCEQQFPVLKEGLLSIHKKLSAILYSANILQKKEHGDKNRFRENVKKALAAAGDLNSDTGIELIKKLLPYDFGGEVNILLENALAEFKNSKYENAVKSLTKIILSVE